MKSFSVNYDKFCVGKFTLSCEEDDSILSDDGLGAFEMYVLSMWSDGVVVTMKGYDDVAAESYFILLLPDGSEQLMTCSQEGVFEVKPYRNAGEGRMAYLLTYSRGLTYKGFRGYEEYDEEEHMIIGMVRVEEKTLTYGGPNFMEVRKDFERVVEQQLKQNEISV